MRSTLWAIWLLVPDPFFHPNPHSTLDAERIEAEKSTLHSRNPLPSGRLLTQQDMRRALAHQGWPPGRDAAFLASIPFFPTKAHSSYERLFSDGCWSCHACQTDLLSGVFTIPGQTEFTRTPDAARSLAIHCAKLISFEQYDVEPYAVKPPIRF